MIKLLRFSTRFPFKKMLALSVAGVLFYEVAAIPLAEANQYKNIWESRRKANPTLASGKVFEQIPSASSALPQTNQLNSSLVADKAMARVSEDLRSMISSVPLLNGTVKQMFDPKNATAAPVVLVQDIHQNAEAQNNIAAVLDQLIVDKKIDALGVEAAFGSFDFAPFHAFPDAAVVKTVAQDMLDKHLMSAPSFVGITRKKDLPTFLGVDDEKDHAANVAAYLATRALVASVEKNISKDEAALEKEKARVFSAELLRFDGLRQSFQKDALGFGAYLKKLVSMGAEADFVVERFVMAYDMESKIDFARVDQERKSVIEKLIPTLNDKELNDLLVKSAAYRLGRLNYGAYYGDLKTLCQSKGVDLGKTPAFDNYIRYVLLSDGIPADELFNRVADLERDVVKRLAATPEQKALVEKSERLGLSRKLVKFELTPKEWERYQVLRVPGLEKFEEFYVLADKRSATMVNKLLQHKFKKGAVVVSGGYHTPEIFALLKSKKVPVVVVAPKLTKVSTEDGSAYLTVFAREKTPLDKLFAGEKLFVGNPAETIGSGAAQTSANRMARATIAFRTLLTQASVKFSALTGVVVKAFDGKRRRAELTVDGVPVTATASGVAAVGMASPLGEHFQPTGDSWFDGILTAVAVVAAVSPRLRAWVSQKVSSVLRSLNNLRAEIFPAGGFTQAKSTWAVRALVVATMAGILTGVLLIHPGLITNLYFYSDLSVLAQVFQGLPVSPLDAFDAFGSSLTYSRALAFPIVAGLLYKTLFSLYGFIGKRATGTALRNNRGQVILHFLSDADDYFEAITKRYDAVMTPSLRAALQSKTLGQLRRIAIDLEKQSDSMTPLARGEPKTWSRVFLNAINPLHLAAFFKSFFFSSYLNQISYSMRGQYASNFQTTDEHKQLAADIVNEAGSAGLVRSAAWTLWKQDIFLIGAVRFFLKRLPMIAVSAVGGWLVLPLISEQAYFWDVLGLGGLAPWLRNNVPSMGFVGRYAETIAKHADWSLQSMMGSVFNALGLLLPGTFRSTLRGFRANTLDIRKQVSWTVLVRQGAFWRRFFGEFGNKNFAMNLVDSTWGMLTLNAEIAVVLQVSHELPGETAATAIGLLEGRHAKDAQGNEINLGGSAMDFGHEVMGLLGAVVSAPHAVVTNAPVQIAKEIVNEPASRAPAAAFNRLALVAAGVAALGALVDSFGDSKQDPVPPQGQEKERVEATKAWIEKNIDPKYRFPLENRGEKNLENVSFLYGTMQRVNQLIMEKRLDEAKTLYLNATVNKAPNGQYIWRRNYGGPVLSENILTEAAFESRVKNGVTLQVANAGLNLWAALNGTDDTVFEISKDALDHVLDQHRYTGHDGRIVHGPPGGNQGFENDVRFQDVMTPEYQIDFYRPAKIIGDLTGDAKYRAAADRALTYLVSDQQYDPSTKRFFARNEAGRVDFPPDAPAWALSMVGPDELARRGIDVVQLIDDLGDLDKVAGDLSRPIKTEFLLIRMVALKDKGIPYLRAQGRAAELDRAEAELQRLKTILFNLPLQSEANGGGWADGYRLKSVNADPFASSSWLPAEGSTNWGWSLQKGSSMNAAAYVLFFAGNFDPMSQPVDWSALRAPSLAAGRTRHYEFGAGGDAAIFESGVFMKAAQDAYRAGQTALGRIIVSPNVGSFETDRRVFRNQDQIAEDVGDLAKLDDNATDLETNEKGPFAAINFRNKMSEQRFVRLDEQTVLRVGDPFANSDQPRFRYFVVDPHAEHPALGYEAVARFYYLTEAERLTNPVRGQENAPSYESWVQDNPGLVDPALAQVELDEKTGLSREINNQGFRVGRYSDMVVFDPYTNQILETFESFLANPNAPEMVFKTHMDAEAKAYLDNIKQTDPSRYAMNYVKHGDGMKWMLGINTKVKAPLDMRAKGPSANPEENARILTNPRYNTSSDGGNTVTFGKIYLEGLERGMVIRPNSEAHYGQPSTIYLRPDYVGDRSFLKEHPFLAVLEEEATKNPDAATAEKLDAAFKEWRIAMSWLADMEAYLEIRRTKILLGLWDLSQIERAVELPKIQGMLAQVRAARAQYVFNPDTKEFAKPDLFKTVTPRVSEYEKGLWEFADYLRDIKKQINSESDEARREKLRRLQSRALSELTWGEGAVLIPGHRDAERSLSILKDVYGLNGPARQRQPRPREPWAFIEAEKERLPIPLPEQYRKYDEVFSEDGRVKPQPTSKWVRVKQSEQPAFLQIQNNLGDPDQFIMGRDLRITRAGQPTMALDATPLPLVRPGLRPNERINDLDARIEGTLQYRRVILDRRGDIEREELYSLGNQSLSLRNFETEVQRLIESGEAQRLEQTVHKPGRTLEVTVDSANGPSQKMIYSTPNRSDPETKLLRKENLASGVVEVYADHHFNPYSGTWIPGRVDIQKGANVLETRVLKTDERGDPVFGKDGEVTYDVERRVGAAVVGNTEEKIDIFGNLARSFDRKTRLVTTYDTRREQEAFIDSGLRLQIPTQTFVADENGNPVGPRPFVTYVVRFPQEKSFSEMQIQKVVDPSVLVAGFNGNMETQSTETWRLVDPGNGDVKHRLVQIETGRNVIRHQYNRANVYDKPSETIAIAKVNGVVLPEDRFSYRDRLRLDDSGEYIRIDGAFVVDRQSRLGEASVRYENDLGQVLRIDQGILTTKNKNFAWDPLTNSWKSTESFVGAAERINAGDWERTAAHWKMLGNTSAANGTFDWASRLDGVSVWSVRNPISEQEEIRSLNFDGLLVRRYEKLTGAVVAYDVATSAALKNIWNLAVEVPESTYLGDENGTPGEELIRHSVRLDPMALSGERFDFIEFRSENRTVRSNNVATTRMEVRPWSQWWGENLLSHSQLRPVETRREIPIGTSRTQFEYNDQNVAVRQVKTFFNRDQQPIVNATEFSEVKLDSNGRPAFETIELADGSRRLASVVDTQTSLREVMRDNIDQLGQLIRRYTGEVRPTVDAAFSEALLTSDGIVRPGRWSSNAVFDWEFVTEFTFASRGQNSQLDRYRIALQSPMLFSSEQFSTDINQAYKSPPLERSRFDSIEIDAATGEPAFLSKHEELTPAGDTNYTWMIGRNRWSDMLRFIEHDMDQRATFVTEFSGLTGLPGVAARAQRFVSDASGRPTGEALSTSMTPEPIRIVPANTDFFGQRFSVPTMLVDNYDHVLGQRSQSLRGFGERIVMTLEGRVDNNQNFIPEIWHRLGFGQVEGQPRLRAGASTSVTSGFLNTVETLAGPELKDASAGRYLGLRELPAGRGLIGHLGTLAETRDELFGTIIRELRDGPGKLAIRYDLERKDGKEVVFREAHYDYAADVGRTVPPGVAHRIEIKEKDQTVRLLDFHDIDQNGYAVYKVVEEEFLGVKSRVDKLEYGLTYIGYGIAGRTFEDHIYPSNPNNVRVYSKYGIPVFSTTSDFEGQPALYKIYNSRVVRFGGHAFVYAEMKTPPPGMGQRGILGEFYRKYVELPLEKEQSVLYGPTWVVIEDGRHLNMQDGWKISEDIQQLTQYSFKDHFRNSLIGRSWTNLFGERVDPEVLRVRDSALGNIEVPEGTSIQRIKTDTEIPTTLIERTPEQVRRATWGEINFLMWNYGYPAILAIAILWFARTVLMTLVNWGYWQKHKSINFNEATVSDFMDLRKARFIDLLIPTRQSLGLTHREATDLYLFRRKYVAFKSQDELAAALVNDNPELAQKVNVYLSRFHFRPKNGEKTVTNNDIRSMRVGVPPRHQESVVTRRLIRMGELPSNHVLGEVQYRLRDFLHQKLLTTAQLAEIMNKYAQVLEPGLMTRKQVAARILAEATKKALWEDSNDPEVGGNYGLRLKPRFHEIYRSAADDFMKRIGLKNRNLLSGLAFNSDEFIDETVMKDVAGLTFDFDEISVDPLPGIDLSGVYSPVNRYGRWFLGSLEDSLIRKIIRKAIPFAAGQSQYEYYMVREVYFLLRANRGQEVPAYLERQRAYWYGTMQKQLAKLERLRDMREADPWEYVFTWEELNDFFRYLQGQTDWGPFPSEWADDEKLISLRINGARYLEILNLRLPTEEETRILIFDIAEPLIKHVRGKLGIVKVEKPMTQAEFTMRGVFHLLTNYTTWKRFLGDNVTRRSIKTTMATAWWITKKLFTLAAVTFLIWVVYTRLDLIPISWSFKELSFFVITDPLHAIAKSWVLLVLADMVISMYFAVSQVAKAQVASVAGRFNKIDEAKTWRQTRRMLPQFLEGPKNEFSRLKFLGLIDDLIFESDMTSREAAVWKAYIAGLEDGATPVAMPSQPESTEARERIKSWVNSQNREDMPRDPRSYSELASYTVQQSAWAEVFTLEHSDVWAVNDPQQLEHRVGMMARAYREKWNIFLQGLLEQGKTSSGKIDSEGITEGQYEFLKSLPDSPLRAFSESGLIRDSKVDKRIVAWVNNRLGIGSKTLNGAFKLRKVYEMYIRKFFPNATDEDVKRMVEEKVQIIAKHDLPALSLDTRLNYTSLHALVDDLKTGERSMEWALWRVGDIAGVNVEAYLTSLLTMSKEQIDAELSNRGSPAKKIQEQIFANGLGKLLKDRGADKTAGKTIFPDSKVDMVLKGILKGVTGLEGAALTTESRVANYVKYLADNGVELQWWKKGISDVHQQAKYTQWANFFSQVRGELTLALDMDHELLWEEVSNLPNAGMEFKINPKLGVAPYRNYTFTKPISRVGRAMATAEEAWLGHELRVKQEIGLVGMYGKAIFRTQFARDVEFLQEEYVAEDLMGALKLASAGLHTKTLNYVNLGKGLSTSYMEALAPLRKWSGDSGEVLLGATAMKFMLSPALHWTKKIDTIVSLSFYYKKPRVVRYVTLLAIFHYAFPGNPLTGLSLFGWFAGVVLAQAISYGALYNYLQRHGYIKGWAVFLYEMVFLLMPFYMGILPHYSDSVQRGFRKGAKFIPTGGKGGPLSRMTFERLYIDNSYAITRGGYLLILALISPFDPFRVAIWTFLLLTMTYWFMAPFLFNPERPFGKGFNTFVVGSLLVALITWVLSMSGFVVLMATLGWMAALAIGYWIFYPKQAVRTSMITARNFRQNARAFFGKIWETNVSHILRGFFAVIADFLFSILYFPLGLVDKMSGGRVYEWRMFFTILGSPGIAVAQAARIVDVVSGTTQFQKYLDPPRVQARDMWARFKLYSEMPELSAPLKGRINELVVNHAFGLKAFAEGRIRGNLSFTHLRLMHKLENEILTYLGEKKVNIPTPPDAPLLQAQKLWAQFNAYAQVPELDPTLKAQIQSLVVDRPNGLKQIAERRVDRPLAAYELRMLRRLARAVRSDLIKKKVEVPETDKREYQAHWIIQVIDIVPFFDWFLAFFPKGTDFKWTGGPWFYGKWEKIVNGFDKENKWGRGLVSLAGDMIFGIWYLVIVTPLLALLVWGPLPLWQLALLTPWVVILSVGIVRRFGVLFINYLTGLAFGRSWFRFRELEKMGDVRVDERAALVEQIYQKARVAEQNKLGEEFVDQLVDMLRDNALIIRRAARRRLDSLNFSAADWISVWTDLLASRAEIKNPDVLRQGANGLADVVESAMSLDDPQLGAQIMKTAFPRLVEVALDEDMHPLVRRIALARIYVLSKTYTGLNGQLAAAKAIDFTPDQLEGVQLLAKAPKERNEDLNARMLRREAFNVLVSIYHVSKKDGEEDLSAEAARYIVRGMRDPDNVIALFALQVVQNQRIAAPSKSTGAYDLLVRSGVDVLAVAIDDALGAEIRVRAIEALSVLYNDRNAGISIEMKSDIRAALAEMLKSDNPEIVNQVLKFFQTVGFDDLMAIQGEIDGLYQKWAFDPQNVVHEKQRNIRTSIRGYVLNLWISLLRGIKQSPLSLSGAKRQVFKRGAKILLAAFLDPEKKIRGEAIQAAKKDDLISPSLRANAHFLGLTGPADIKEESILELDKLKQAGQLPASFESYARNGAPVVSKRESQILTALERLLVDGSPKVRESAAKAIGRYNLGSTDRINLWQTSFGQGTGLRSRNKALTELSALSQDPNLAAAERETAAKAFNNVFQQSQWPDLIMDSLKVVTKAPNPFVFDDLKRLIHDDNPAIQLEAVRAMAGYAAKFPENRSRVVEELSSLIDIYNRNVRVAAINVLGDLGADALASKFLVMTKTWRSFPIREASMSAIKKLIQSEATAEEVRPLVQTQIARILADNEVVIRQIAASIFDQLGMRDDQKFHAYRKAISKTGSKAAKAEAYAAVRKIGLETEDQNLRVVIGKYLARKNGGDRVSAFGSFVAALPGAAIVTVNVLALTHGALSADTGTGFAIALVAMSLGAMGVVASVFFLYQAIRIRQSLSLASPNKTRGSPNFRANLIAAFQDKRIIDMRGTVAQVLTDPVDGKKVMYADKNRLAVLPQWLQESILVHENAHMKGKNEIQAYWAQFLFLFKISKTLPILIVNTRWNFSYRIFTKSFVILKDRTQNRKQREAAIRELIAKSPLSLELGRKLDVQKSGFVEGDVFEILATTLWERDSRTKRHVEQTAEMPAYANAVWEHLTEDVAPGSRKMFAGSLETLAVEARLLFGYRLQYFFLKDDDANFAAKAKEQLARMVRSNAYIGFVVESESAKAELKRVLGDSPRYHVIVRTPSMTLSQILDVSKELSATFKRELAEGKGYVDVLIPHNLGTPFPDNFNDLDPQQANRYRVFLILTETLNAMTLQLKEDQWNNLNNLDRLWRKIGSQA